MSSNYSDTVRLSKIAQYFCKHPVPPPTNKIFIDACPFLWSWDAIVYEGGNVIVTLYQREKNPEETGRNFDFFYSRDEIISALEEIKSSTAFVQVVLESKLGREIQILEHALELYYSTKHNGHCREGLLLRRIFDSPDDSNPDYTINRSDVINDVHVYDIVTSIAWGKALGKVFHSSIAYDSPYGGGKNSIYNLLDFSGSITSSPSTP